ncbi:MAG: transporter substrate-binding domain-containing protein [Phycisphaera sp.]|nr:transporter substrate-binding domain-containing protein [Phycisphaera sp.]
MTRIVKVLLTGVLAAAWSAVALAQVPVATIDKDVHTGPAHSHHIDPDRVYVVGITRDFPPYEFVNDKGEPDGFGVDITRAVAGVLGMKVRFEPDVWSNTRKKLKEGKVDFVPGMLYSDARAQDFAFTIPYLHGDYNIFVRKGQKRIANTMDLHGHRGIVERSSLMHDMLTSLGLDGNVILADSEPDALRRLNRGEGDYALAPLLAGKKLIHDEHLFNTVALDEPFTEAHLCMAVVKSNAGLRDELNEGLATINASGEYAAIYERWFGITRPSRMTWMDVLSYARWAVLITMMLLLVVLAWSWSLKRRVDHHTTELKHKLEEHRRAEAALTESETRFRQMSEAAPTIIWLSNSTGELTYFNKCWRDFTGRPEEEHLGEGWARVMHPGDLQQITNLWLRVNREKTTFESECRLLRHDGQWRWILTIGSPRVAPDGSFIGFIGMCLDITDRKLNELRQQTFVRELDHRVKNNLTSVLALAEQTAQNTDSRDEFIHNFTQRVRAMSAAHDALYHHNWRGTSFHDLSRRVLEPYTNSHDTRLHASGPNVQVPARMAMPLALIVNELMTNCIKHGALSPRGGSVDLTWQCDGPRLSIQWKEATDEPVTAEHTDGYGLKLIEGLVRYELCGKVSFDLTPRGMCCVIDFDLLCCEKNVGGDVLSDELEARAATPQAMPTPTA